MHAHCRQCRQKHRGFGLVEVLVGLAIGMLTILLIMQVMTTFEGQKRATGGSNDAQTNGSIALYTIQRMVQTSGFDLPMYSAVFQPLNCSPEPTIDHDANAATANIGIYPVFVTDGGAAAGASDTITVLTGSATAGTGQSMSGIPSLIRQLPGGNVVVLDNNLACLTGDIALVMQSTRIYPTPQCYLKQVASITGTTQVTLNNTTSIAVGDGITCLKNWNSRAYSVASGNLLENTDTIVTGIVNIQAQYGISVAPDSNEIVDWVDPSGGTWAAPTIENRKLIKAIRIAVIARSGELERTNVTNACSSTTAANPTGLCAWAGTAADPAPTVDLSNDANWRRYRYRVFESVVPLKNVIAGMGSL